MLRQGILMFLLVLTIVSAGRTKRQLSIDDLISRALSLVRPIFDTSQPLQNDEMLRKQPEPSTDELRDSSILGARHASPLDDLPLCRGNNRICQFISCSAENFKQDPTFGNLQLAAQVLGDEKLRKAISSNPETIDVVCKEQGMDDSQCKLFSKGFQLIDRFITTIERPAKSEESSNPVSIPPQVDYSVRKENDIAIDDTDYVILSPSPASPAHHRAMGSKTWSSQPEQSELQLLDARNDLVSNLTPLPPLLSPPPFIHPTPPPAPPLAFPTVPSFILSPLKLPELNNALFLPTDKSIFDLPIKRIQRSTNLEDLDAQMNEREKRDYYDDLNTKPSSLVPTNSGSDSEDYYGSIDEITITRAPPKNNPLRNCINILGFY